MQPGQRDYGGPDSESQLVPGALRVYRHFLVKSHDESYPAEWDAPMITERLRVGLTSMNTKDLPGVGPVHSAECRRIEAATHGMLPYSAWYAAAAPPRSHKSPHERCACGFYAHYDPATDFYPAMAWCDPTLGTNGRLTLGALLDDQAAFSVWVEPFIAVRAVVEMSGKVVMGSLGVRAEKMKVVALSVDWSKYAQEKTVTTRTEPTPYWVKVKRAVVGAAPGDEVADRVTRLARKAADAHGAKFYDSSEQMYEEHPKEDLAALGVKERTQSDVGRAYPYSSSFGFSQSASATLTPALYDSLRQSIQQAAAAMSQLQSIQQATAAAKSQLSRNTSPSPSPTGPPSMPPSVRAALEAKRNRKAPPGTGIDRRKKKL
jgi:hypothetical protein